MHRRAECHWVISSPTPVRMCRTKVSEGSSMNKALEIIELKFKENAVYDGWNKVKMWYPKYGAQIL